MKETDFKIMIMLNKFVIDVKFENQDSEYHQRMCNKYLKFNKRMKVHDVFAHSESFTFATLMFP